LLQEVDRTVAATFANEVGALYFETSAKEDTNIHDLFVKLSELEHVTRFIYDFGLTCCSDSGSRLPAPPTADTSVIKPSALQNKQQAKKAGGGGCC
jgi:hypothetical protein